MDQQRVTVNSVHYLAMLEDYFFSLVQNQNQLAEFWFQQDGATCHTAAEIFALLQERLLVMLFSRRGPVNFPVRSCDLTPCDFFLSVRPREMESLC